MNDHQLQNDLDLDIGLMRMVGKKADVTTMKILSSRTFKSFLWGCIQKFADWVITKYKLTTISTRWEVTQRVMATEVTTLTHKIAIQLHLVAKNCTTCSSRSSRPVRKLLDTPSYISATRQAGFCQGRLYPTVKFNDRISCTILHSRIIFYEIHKAYDGLVRFCVRT